MARLQLRSVTKRLGGHLVVNNVSFDVRDGEFFVLVGPNGCGKTTLLRLIAGVLKPDSGEILIDGGRVNDLKPRDRGVRMVFQNYALYPHMLVYSDDRYSNLNFALKLRRYLVKEIRRIVSEVSERVGIDRKLYSRRPDELSEGEKQKVAVGRALILQPRIFLLDEPLSNLDPLARMKVRQEIRRIQRELEATTVYVTHDLAEAMALGDRMAVMKEGSIQQVGTPDYIYNYPSNEFVAAYIRSYDLSRKV